jgi:uncharacterized repeat protein (TIGR01451 family)
MALKSKLIARRPAKPKWLGAVAPDVGCLPGRIAGPLLLALVLMGWMILVVEASTGAGRARLISERQERGNPAESGALSGTTTLALDWRHGQPAKVEPSLLKRVMNGSAGDPFRFVVEMEPQTDALSLTSGLPRAARQQPVVSQLKATAEDAQADVLTFLEAQNSEGHVQRVRPFWIFNGLAVTADAETLLALAARSDVRLVREDRWRRWVDFASEPERRTETSEDGAEWNLARIRADEAWSALGLDGSGVTVAIMDTGVDWQHPALQAQYRGNKPGGLAVHQGNWLCTTDEGYLYPVDGSGHGTHVAGTAVGREDAGGTAIGVAPGARWIAVKMLNDAGYGYDSWIHAAFEWLMAPDGEPALAPDIVNGSWGSPNDEDEVFRADLQALVAAGIVPIFSAGNEGPPGQSLRSPASYPEAIAVGATDDIDEVADFSSRGPSPWGEVKPEVVAPGIQIRSSLPGGTFGAKQGTSMAAPHVAGLIALMLQADPTLTASGAEEILTSSAVPLGKTIPNVASGWGRVDAYQATAVALSAGYVVGHVTRLPDHQPLSAARITMYDHAGYKRATVQAADNGNYRVALPEAQYRLEIGAFGYETETVPDVTVESGLTTVIDRALSPAPSGVLWGQVLETATGGPVSAEVKVAGTPAKTWSDPQTGQYSLVLPAGTFTVEVVRNGFRRLFSEGVEIITGSDTRLDIGLESAPTLLMVDSGRWYYGSQSRYLEQALDDRGYVYDVLEVRDLASDPPSTEELSPYEITIWSSPLDSPGLIGAGDVISSYLSTGGNLVLTGQDIGFWDGGLNYPTWHEYYRRFLKAIAETDNAGRSSVVGLSGDILGGLALEMNGIESAANQVSPDSFLLLDDGDAVVVGRYADAGNAALRASECQSYHAFYLAAGLEGLGDRASRAETMERSLTWLDTPHPVAGAILHPAQQEQVWLHGTSVTYTLELQNTGRSLDQYDLELSPSVWPAAVWDGAFSEVITQSVALDACETQDLGIRVTVPPGVTWNASDSVTLTVRSLGDPAQTAQAAFSTKAPAPILLVDDHRWRDVGDRYRAALDANGLPYDMWRKNASGHPDGTSPSLQRMQRYAIVLWFTAYDWHETLTPDEEARLAAYLEGGGRLLLSSQDYLYTSGFTLFARDYLGVANYTESLTATQVLGSVGSPVGSGRGPYDLTYPFPNWSDALRPVPDAGIAFWGQHAQPVALTHEQPPWRTEFFAFPLEALAAVEMSDVVGKAVDWLSPLSVSSLVVDRLVAGGGETLAYTLTMRNTGPELLSSVSLSNTLPASTVFVTDSLIGPGAYDPATNRVTWTGQLDTGQVVTISYEVKLESSLPDGAAVQNVAQLVDESGVGLRRVATTRVNAPELSTSVKAASGLSAGVGDVLTYTVSLRNQGLRPATAQFSDPVPLNTGHVPGSARASGGYVTSTDKVVWWSGDIATHGSVTITVPVWVSSAAAGRHVLNRATLDDGWGQVQPLEAFTWVEPERLYLPVVLRQP